MTPEEQQADDEARAWARWWVLRGMWVTCLGMSGYLAWQGRYSDAAWSASLAFVIWWNL